MSVRPTNRFWSVSLEHTLFLDFLKLFVNMRLALSFTGKQKMYFLNLRIKSYGCLKFQGEVWAGQACAGANQQELTTCTKSGGQEEKTFQEKLGTAPQAQVTTRGRRATAGRRTAGDQRLGPSCLAATGPRPLVAGIPATRGRRPQVGGPGLAGDQRSPAGRRSTPAPVGQFKFF
jgi:hypothetical protein